MIELWFCDISVFSETEFYELLRYCSKKEQEEILRYRFLKDRLFRLVGRQMINMRYGNSTSEIQVSESGKPQLISRQKFNISHSGDIVAVVFSEKEIGLDIELSEQVDFSAIADNFHIDEQTFIRETSETKTHEAFYHVWTRKEAFLKALGIGIVEGLHQHNCLVDQLFIGNEYWHLRSLYSLTGYKVAVCQNGLIDTVVSNKIGSKELMKRIGCFE